MVTHWQIYILILILRVVAIIGEGNSIQFDKQCNWRRFQDPDICLAHPVVRDISLIDWLIYIIVQHYSSRMYMWKTFWIDILSTDANEKHDIIFQYQP